MKPLNKGDLVALTAPSFHFPPDDYKDALKKLTQDLGLDVYAYPRILDQHGYFAGTDLTRAQGLRTALTYPKAKAVLFARGGYGVGAVLKSVFWESPLRKQQTWVRKKTFAPRIIAGYSDHTVLLNLLAQRYRWSAFHAPVLVGKSFTQSQEIETQSFLQSLFTNKPLRKIFSSSLESLCGGKAVGPILGGNLTVLLSSLGTPFFPKLKGSVLFLEEVTEAPYRIDRMLVQLIDSGQIDDVAAVVLGQFTDCMPSPKKDYAKSTFSVRDVIEERLVPFCRRLKIPLVSGFQSGHGRPQITFPLNVKVEVNAPNKKNSATVDFLESPFV